MSRNTQIIATMRHEMDILSSHRASIKAIEAENADLKSKLDLMMSIESVLTASQKEVDEILKQNLNTETLSVLVGTLRRELSSNEIRKNELRKQLQILKSDLRCEQEERRKLQDRLSVFESENHAILRQLKRLEAKTASQEINEVEASDIETPEAAKRPRLALKHLGDLNTPSPLGNEEFQNRIAQVRESDSPYLKVAASSIALTSVLKRPMLMKEAHRLGATKKPEVPRSRIEKLSIFNKPRVALTGLPTITSENTFYNGFGGTTKVLQSDFKKSHSCDNFFGSSASKPNNPIKKKKLSPSLLGK